MRRFTRVIGIMAAVTIAVLTSTAVPAAATTTWTDVWIQQAGGPLCAVVPNTTAGAAVQQATCVDLNTQLWIVGPAFVGSTADTIKNLGSGLCMAAGGTAVSQVACTLANDRLWALSGSGNTFQIRNVATGTCLSTNGTTPGTPVTLVTCKPTILGPHWQLLF